jgi:hypothetical protein
MTWDLNQAAAIPAFGKVVLETLQFLRPSLAKVRPLNSEEWKSLLAFCDEAQLIFTFSYLYGSELPDWVRSRIDQNRKEVAIRRTRLESAFKEIAHGFSQVEIEFLLLKGCAHAREFGPDVSLRITSDLDLWCSTEQIERARDELIRLGYRAVGKGNGRHLAAMIREKEWRWSGNFHAPDLPYPVELHHRLWDEEMEGIQGPPEDAFWRRRSHCDFDGTMASVLSLPDALAFSALHLLMHILHGDLRLQRAWEIAYFLEHRFSDDAFWREWKNLHASELRKLEVIIFFLVEKWFGCKLPFAVRSEAEALGSSITHWIEFYGFSPVEALFNSNKAELWLHLCLVSTLRDKIRIFLRRMLPIHGARTISFGENDTPRGILRRANHHVRGLVPTLGDGFQFWRTQGAKDRSRLSTAYDEPAR